MRISVSHQLWARAICRMAAYDIGMRWLWLFCNLTRGRIAAGVGKLPSIATGPIPVG
jgi:hypothetical protein